MADADLTSTILRFTDRHLGLPLLSHLANLDLFKQEDVNKAMYQLAEGTSMVDFALQLHEQAYPGQAPPAELEKKREQILEQNDRLAKDVEAVLTVIEDPAVANSLKQDKAQNLHWLEENYKLTLDQIKTLYQYGYFQYSAGNYRDASSYLYHFRVLSTDPVLTISSHWGKLASDILTGEWDRALEELKLLRDFIDNSRPDQGGHEAILERRTWLLHWSLFVWFNHPEGREGLVEMFLSPAYLNTIQTTCWWLLRYLVAALITTRRSSRVYVIQSSSGIVNAGMPATTKMSPSAALQEVTKILQQEGHRNAPQDPILQFLRELYSNFNFEAAQQELRKAQVVANNDFFIGDHADDFVESARFLVSEAYCRIHKRVDIADLSKRLNMSQLEGEKYITNLVRDLRADAKIDFKEGMVHMNQTHVAVYQEVIEKTRGFTFRSAAMGQAMDRKAHPVSTANGGTGAGEGGRGGRGAGAGRGGGRGGRGGGRTGGDRNTDKTQVNGSAAPAAVEGQQGGAAGTPAAAAVAPQQQQQQQQQKEAIAA